MFRVLCPASSITSVGMPRALKRVMVCWPSGLVTLVSTFTPPKNRQPATLLSSESTSGHTPTTSSVHWVVPLLLTTQLRLVRVCPAVQVKLKLSLEWHVTRAGSNALATQASTRR